MYGNGDINQLSGPERKQLRAAIMNAYTTIPDLRIMVAEELDMNLSEIGGGEKLNTVVFNLIEWAKRTCKVKDLIEAAYRGNTGNTQLQTVRKQLLDSKSSKFTNNSPQTAEATDSNQRRSVVSDHTIQTQAFEFETATLGKNLQINRSRRQAESFQEDLGNRVFLEMVEISGGHFLMGSPEDEVERTEYEGPQHIVTISPFFMGKFPITQLQYQAIMGENPSRFKGINKPVESVSWDNAVDFCGRISKRTGKTYRLPSEAEWEYACRAGTTTPFYFGETITTDLANYNGNSTYGSAPKGQDREQTTDVGSFPANAFGLYDMHGNVWEWCEDIWHENYNGAPYNGDAWVLNNNDNHYRLLRGGSWINDPWFCRSAYRSWNERDDSYVNVGFRVVVASSRTS